MYNNVLTDKFILNILSIKYFNIHMYFQVQDLGLAPSYKEKQTTYDFIRRLFALPFLPHEHITPCFKKLRKSATTPRLEKLMRYISKNRAYRQ